MVDQARGAPRNPREIGRKAVAWGYRLQAPTLYLHGTNDGCHGMTREQVARVPGYCGPGSESELIEGVGHFMLVERPEAVNERIVGFLQRVAPARAHPATVG
jgi:pimeloyl-ACP methyl ester carboxylesterase